MPTINEISDRDYDWQNSDEYISEHLEANDYDFEEDGSTY
jgi:hypothetical protein